MKTNIYGEFHPDLVSAGKEAITKLFPEYSNLPWDIQSRILGNFIVDCLFNTGCDCGAIIHRLDFEEQEKHFKGAEELLFSNYPEDFIEFYQEKIKDASRFRSVLEQNRDRARKFEEMLEGDGASLARVHVFVITDGDDNVR